MLGVNNADSGTFGAALQSADLSLQLHSLIASHCFLHVGLPGNIAMLLVREPDESNRRRCAVLHYHYPCASVLALSQVRETNSTSLMNHFWGDGPQAPVALRQHQR